MWYSLPEELLQCHTVQTFKRHLDLCLYNRGYTSAFSSFFPRFHIKLSKLSYSPLNDSPLARLPPGLFARHRVNKPGVKWQRGKKAIIVLPANQSQTIYSEKLKSLNKHSHHSLLPPVKVSYKSGCFAAYIPILALNVYARDCVPPCISVIFCIVIFMFVCLLE